MLVHPCHRQHLVTRPSCPVWSGHRAPPPDPFLVARALGVISVRVRALAYRRDAPGQLVPGRTRPSPRALLLGAFRAHIRESWRRGRLSASARFPEADPGTSLGTVRCGGVSGITGREGQWDGAGEAENSVVSASGSLEVSVAQPRAAWVSTATLHGGACRQRAGSCLPVPIPNWLRAGPEGRSVPRGTRLSARTGKVRESSARSGRCG